MALKTRLIRLLSAPRLREIDRFMEHPAQVQQRQLRRLLDRAAPTLFGTEHGFHAIRTAEQFASRVPVTDYDGFTPYIERMRRGEADVCWPGEVRWFAKSSGTTSAKSKFIPVSREGLRGCHMRGPLDIVCLTSSLWPDTDVFSGKTLTLGGSRRLETTGGRAQEGDLSAILIENTPWLAGRMRVPKPETALIPDFEKKVEAICRETVGQNVTAFAGVPSWNLVMLRKVLEFTGKSNLLEVWPRLELFTHGGMNFKPYREQYRQLIPSDRMKYMETYNASEGFFAIQNDPASDDLLLMLDYGVYYEFLPVRDLDDPSRAVPLEGVAKGINYAMIITTCNGLWRYQIGDTVEFTSLAPYKIRITGARATISTPSARRSSSITPKRRSRPPATRPARASATTRPAPSTCTDEAKDRTSGSSNSTRRPTMRSASPTRWTARCKASTPTTRPSASRIRR